MKQFLLRTLARSELMRWGAPIATLRRLIGWRPLPPPLASARNILVIRQDEIGDLVLTGPFLRELRRAAPQAHITLLVNVSYYNLVEYCPHVDSVYGFPFRAAPMGAYQVKLRWHTLLFRWKHFRCRRFDLVLLPRRDSDWYDAEFVAYLLAGSGAVMENQKPLVRNSQSPPISRAHFQAFHNPNIEHEVLHNLRFLKWCGAEGASVANDLRLELWLTDDDRAFARRWLDLHLPHRRPLIIMHPSGGRSILKQWPIERFNAVLQQLARDRDCDFLVIGGSDEEWVKSGFGNVAGGRIAFAHGQLTLRQLSAVCELGVLFIGGDSGPMHLAAASGIPVIGVFGSTSEVRFRPWGANCRVVSLRYSCSPDITGTFESRCSTCLYSEPRCLTELKTESVLREAFSWLTFSK